MNERHEPVTARENDHRWPRRISWGAIFAGLFVALGVQMLLGFLGAAIGLAVLNPADPATFTIGAGIWLIISGIVSLFVGGWIAGRLSGEPAGLDRAINGLVVWGVVTLVSLYIVTATTVSVVSGAFGLVGSALATAGQAVAGVAPDVAKAVQEQIGGPELQNLRNQAEQLLEQATDTLQSPEARQELQQELEVIYSAFSQLVMEGEMPPPKKEEIEQILASRTEMTRQEADSTLSNWVQQAKQVRRQAMAQADSLRQAAEGAADAVAKASGWIFFILLLDAAAAIVGALVGFPGTKY